MGPESLELSWSAGLIAIEIDNVAYVCRWDELDSYQPLVAVSPAGNTEALANAAARRDRRGHGHLLTEVLGRGYEEPA